MILPPSRAQVCDRAYSNSNYWLELEPYAFCRWQLNVDKSCHSLPHRNFHLGTMHIHLQLHNQYIPAVIELFGQESGTDVVNSYQYHLSHYQ